MAFKLKKPKIKIPTVADAAKAVQNPGKVAVQAVDDTVAGMGGQRVLAGVKDPLGAVNTNIGTLKNDTKLAWDELIRSTGWDPTSMFGMGAGSVGSVGGAGGAGGGAIGSVAPGNTGSAFASYVEGLKAQPAISPFAVSPIQAQQIAGQLGTQSAFAPQQAQIAQLLLDRAQGRGGPSPAELMLAQQQDKIRNMALAQAASTSGRAMGAVGRQIGQQQILGAQEAMRNAAILRAQEQQQAGMDAAKALEMGRTGELALRGQQQAALTADQQAALEAQKVQSSLGLQAQTDAAKLNEQRQQMIMQGSLGGLENQRQYDITSAQNATNIALAEFNAKEAARQAEAQRKAQLLGSVLSAGGALGAAYIGKPPTKDPTASATAAPTTT